MKTKGRRIAIAAGLLAAVVLALAVYLGWPHLRFWYRFEYLGLNAQRFPEYRHRQTGIVMVKLPGGKFWMGAQATDPKGQNYDPDAQENEGPVHEVTLSPFMIGKYEVTQAQWKAVIGENPSYFKGDDNLPVEDVVWDDIQEFEEKTGLVLPTEGQWEFTCRAGMTTPFVKTKDSMGLDLTSWKSTKPVGCLPPNEFGIHEMIGNASEWCEDLDDPYPYMKATKETSPTNVHGFRVIRGGQGNPFSPTHNPMCRYSARIGHDQASTRAGFGFRVAYRSP